MLESFTLSGLGLISLDSDDLEKDDYSLLASSSNYRIKKVNSVMKKKRKRLSFQIKPVLFRKKLIKKKSYSAHWLLYTNSLWMYI